MGSKTDRSAASAGAGLAALMNGLADGGAGNFAAALNSMSEGGGRNLGLMFNVLTDAGNSNYARFFNEGGAEANQAFAAWLSQASEAEVGRAAQCFNDAGSSSGTEIAARLQTLYGGARAGAPAAAPPRPVSVQRIRRRLGCRVYGNHLVASCLGTGPGRAAAAQEVIDAKKSGRFLADLSKNSFIYLYSMDLARPSVGVVKTTVRCPGCHASVPVTLRSRPSCIQQGTIMLVVGAVMLALFGLIFAAWAHTASPGGWAVIIGSGLASLIGLILLLFGAHVLWKDPVDLQCDLTVLSSLSTAGHVMRAAGPSTFGPVISETIDRSTGGAAARAETSAHPAAPDSSAPANPVDNRDSDSENTDGVEVLEELCTRKDLFEPEVTDLREEAARRLKRLGEVGTQQLAEFIEDLLTCRAASLAQALAVAEEMPSSPELIEVIRKVSVAPSLGPMPDPCRYTPQIEASNEVGWDDPTASRIRSIAGRILRKLESA